MSGPLVYEYRKTACTEIKTLDKIRAWDVINRTDDMNVIDSKCAYRLKRFQEIPINKPKAHFCACGYKQLEGVLLFQTHAPVVQCTNISVMLIFEELMVFKSKQVNVKAVFLNVNGEEGINILCKYPEVFKKKGKGLNIGKKYVWYLTKSSLLLGISQ